jgi:hypothetical protein
VLPNEGPNRNGGLAPANPAVSPVSCRRPVKALDRREPEPAVSDRFGKWHLHAASLAFPGPKARKTLRDGYAAPPPVMPPVSSLTPGPMVDLIETLRM